MTSWSDDEVKALINIWGDSKVQQELDGAVRNKAIYTTIAKKMKEVGYDCDWQQCKSTKLSKTTMGRLEEQGRLANYSISWTKF